MMQEILLIMRASNGGFSIQWLESVSLETFFNLRDQCVKITPTE